jgi:hypothetical protein
VKRRTVVTDRLSCAIAGGALIAVGLAAAAWERGYLHVPADGSLRLPWLSSAENAPWWPVLLGALAIVVLVLGLVLLAQHRPGQTVGSAPLPGSGDAGSSTVDVNTAASAAATELARNPHVVAASGTSLTDRGQRVIELDVKFDAASDGLPACASALERTRLDLASALEGVPVETRILLRAAPIRGTATRVS